MIDGTQALQDLHVHGQVQIKCAYGQMLVIPKHEFYGEEGIAHSSLAGSFFHSVTAIMPVLANQAGRGWYKNSTELCHPAPEAEVFILVAGNANIWSGWEEYRSGQLSAAVISAFDELVTKEECSTWLRGTDTERLDLAIFDARIGPNIAALFKVPFRPVTAVEQQGGCSQGSPKKQKTGLSDTEAKELTLKIASMQGTGDLTGHNATFEVTVACSGDEQLNVGHVKIEVARIRRMPREDMELFLPPHEDPLLSTQSLHSLGIVDAGQAMFMLQKPGTVGAVSCDLVL